MRTLKPQVLIVSAMVVIFGFIFWFRATRNLLLLVTTLGEIEPALLSDLTRALTRALVQANAEQRKPPGLFKLMSTFWNKDFRRGLAAFNDLLVVFGRNLIEKVPDRG